MNNQDLAILDANEATANVAYRLSEVIAIYPITPSSAMAEFCDEWKTKDQKNLWGVTPEIAQLQSEGGVSGAIHGALQAGTLATTFTASQGLLLMIPNMFKIAGELTPFCMHVTARAIATNALSIFGDHSDVMTCRTTGFAMLASSSVQEAHDMAAIAHSVTLESRIPFMHFFDGFRTSHEINNCQLLSNAQLFELLDENSITQMRMRALTPDNPSIRGTAQNPDVFFQTREACNIFYNRLPSILEKTFEKFYNITGRKYNFFDYYGDPNAERVIIAIGSSTETLTSVAKYLNNHGERVGVIKVRLYRPFSAEHLLKSIPLSVKSIAVLDRTKEPGSLGEPLYTDVAAAIQASNRNINIIRGRYGLGSKEFSPAMAKAVFDELKSPTPKSQFTVGINDDVTHLSLSYDQTFNLANDDTFEAMFFGLGADGTVGANKNTIKIISHETGKFAQAYFVYDSKKSGAMTISHLRFGNFPINAPYLIESANFISCHQFSFINKFDILKHARDNATILINSPHEQDTLWDHFCYETQQTIIKKHLRIFAIDAYQVARTVGIGGRINTIMQTCFFSIANILPTDVAIANIKDAIQKTYSKKGEEIVKKNFAAVDGALQYLFELKIPDTITSNIHRADVVSKNAPEFVQNITAKMLANEGDELPVSSMPIDGIWPSATSQWEKRNIAQEIPEWDPSICIQCNKCSSVCPHAAIRAKYYDSKFLTSAPDGFKSTDFKSRDMTGKKFTIQVAPEDCTGCGLCVAACPAKNKQNPEKKAINMVPELELIDQEKKNFEYFLSLPQPKIEQVTDIKSSQFKRPLFEFSGACSGCGETPYIKLLTQLFGDHLLIANATGCSSIYGGNLPTTPYCIDENGHGPAWANSLFEDNAEFGFGIQLATEKKRTIAMEILIKHHNIFGDDILDKINTTSINEQRKMVGIIENKIQQALHNTTLIDDKRELVLLKDIAKALIHKTTWIIGGDGWAYDIGYGGLDHVLASGHNVNVMILDTEVYSNTGGQQSKSTPTGAVAKFAAGGKSSPKKDIGMLAISYGNIYVAQIALGANDTHAVKSLIEADSYNGPSLIIAYSHCIAHGFDLKNGIEQQKLAVNSGHWPLYRFDPRKISDTSTGFQLDSRTPSVQLKEYMQNETRFNALMRTNPDRAQELIDEEQQRIQQKFSALQKMTQK